MPGVGTRCIAKVLGENRSVDFQVKLTFDLLAASLMAPIMREISGMRNF